MTAQLIIRNARTVPLPETIRISIADSRGRFQVPLEAQYSCLNTDNTGMRWVWCYGKSDVKYLLEPGTYFCIISAGPAWTIDYQKIIIAGREPHIIESSLKRIFSPRREGWLSADSHMHTWRGKQKDDFAAVFEGEDIDFAGIQYWGLYTENEYVETPPVEGCFKIGHTWTTSDEEVEMHSPWGPWEDTTVVGLSRKLLDIRQGFGYRMNAKFYDKARENKCRMIIYQAPTWIQFPVDVILGLVDGVNLCDNYFSIARNTSGPWLDIPGFKSNDPLQGDRYGIAHWIYQNYYRMLNAGYKLPASGGSAYPQGGGGGPAGMGRFYVEMLHEPSPEEFFKNWKDGRTFATNGPILLAEINGKKPGNTLMQLTEDRTQMHLKIISNKPIKRIEWVADGEVINCREFDDISDPQCTVYETEHDLRQYHWVAARCFGESERVLFPMGGQISPPFITAHTSPFYLKEITSKDNIRMRSADGITGHINWMKKVVEGDGSPDSQRYSDFGKLNGTQKEEIYSILDEAIKRLNNSENKM